MIIACPRTNFYFLLTGSSFHLGRLSPGSSNGETPAASGPVTLTEMSSEESELLNTSRNVSLPADPLAEEQLQLPRGNKKNKRWMKNLKRSRHQRKQRPLRGEGGAAQGRQKSPPIQSSLSLATAARYYELFDRVDSGRMVATALNTIRFGDSSDGGSLDE